MTTWNIIGTTEHVALGELQQPSAVAEATPEEGGMSFTDNATNSEEQSGALEHWVEAFDHEMTQSMGDVEAAIASLADKGCPDPQAVADMWIHQQENPDTTEDLSEVPPPEDPSMQAPPQELAGMAPPVQPLASTKKTAMPISPDVAHFHSLLQGGVDPEKLYGAFPQHHPLIDQAVEQHGGGTAPITNDVPIKNPSREELNNDVRNTVNDLRGSLASTKEAGPNNDFYQPNADDLGETGGMLTDPGTFDQVQEDPTILAKEWLHDCFDDEEGAAEAIEALSPEETQAKVEQFYDGGWAAFLQGSNLDDGSGPPYDDAWEQRYEEANGMHGASTKQADLAGKGPKRDKANEIYKAIRRDTDKTKSEAAAIANDEANDLEKKNDLSLGNDEDKKDKSDSKDDKKDDDKPAFLKKKDSRVSYKGINGRVSATYDDLWAGTMVVIATEHGDLTVPAADVEAPVGDAAVEANPVEEINEFLSIIDPAGHIPAQYHARIDNLTQVVTAGKQTILDPKTSLADKIALDEIILKASSEIKDLTKMAEEYSNAGDAEYVSKLPSYGLGAGGVYEQADVGHQSDGGWLDETYHDMMSDTQATDFDRIVSEEPSLLVSDMPDAVLGDQGAAQELATSYISSKTLAVPTEIRTQITTAFVAEVEQARRRALAQRKASMKTAAAALPEADGPAEGLFS